jgi:ribonuclease HI
MIPKTKTAPAGQTIIAYGDGSARQNSATNPGPAGHAWCVTMPDGKTVEYQRHDPAGTNITQEMKALLTFLQWLHPDQPATYRTDLDMVFRGCNEWLTGWKARGWRKSNGKPPENLDLWKVIDPLLSARKVRVEWVKGHSGDPGNERAHVLADEAAQDWGLAEGRLRIIPPC